MKQVLEYFDDVHTFLSSSEEFSAITRTKLLTYSNTEKLSLLKLELSVVVDFAQHFVKATYQLEGNDVCHCFQGI